MIVLGLFGGSFLAFAKSGLLLNPVQPSISVAWQTLTGLLALWRAEIASRRQIQNALGEYLSPFVVERLAEHPERLALGGETRELTVMFADLRDFTKLSEGLDAQEVTRLMNAFLTPMTEAILAAEGTIDKYIGDAIMAFWNAPLDVADHAGRAVAAALAMRGALKRLNSERNEETRGSVPALRMAICASQPRPVQRRQHGLHAAVRLFGAGRQRQSRLPAGGREQGLWRAHYRRAVGRGARAEGRLARSRRPRRQGPLRASPRFHPGRRRLLRRDGGVPGLARRA